MAPHRARMRACAAWRLALVCTFACRVTSAQSDAATGPEAASPRLELEWRSPPDCSERARTLASVERRLGASPQALVAPPLAASASVTRTASGSFHLSLEVRNEGRVLRRDLEASACAELVEAAALILALAIDPELQSRGSPASSVPTDVALGIGGDPPSGAAEAKSRAPVEPKVAPISSTRPAEASLASRRMAFIELGPVTAFGVIPAPAMGVSLSGGFESGSLRFSATGAYFPSARRDVAGASAVFELRALSAALCWLWTASDRWAAGPCAMAEFGSIRAHGEGIELPRATTKRWGSSGIGAVIRFASPRAVEFGMQASLGVPWGRPDFRVVDTEAHRPAALNLGLRAFVGVRF